MYRMTRVEKLISKTNNFNDVKVKLKILKYSDILRLGLELQASYLLTELSNKLIDICKLNRNILIVINFQ